jgi:hypothetical protein
MIEKKLHGHKIVGWIEVERRGEFGQQFCGIVLVEKGPEDYVVGWYKQDDREWNDGHYFSGPDAYHRAITYFAERAKRNSMQNGPFLNPNL